MKFDIRFGPLLRAARERAGLSVYALSYRTSLGGDVAVSQTAIRNYERGHREPGLGMALILAEALGVPLADLYDAVAIKLDEMVEPKRGRPRNPVSLGILENSEISEQS